MSPMTQDSSYRRRAEECTALALTARTQAQRTMLLHIADTWLRLARDAEDGDQTWDELEKLPAARLM